MFQVPREGETPLIKLFQTVSELQKETGQRVFHGIYDSSTNTIMATIDSVAHEIGHYRDFKSGRLVNPADLSDPQRRIEARIRNEIVAILYASTKVGDAGTALEYEIEFLTWLEYMRKTSNFGPHHHRNLSDLTLKEIQDIADFTSNAETPWFERLEYLFREYLSSEHEILTYNKISIE